MFVGTDDQVVTHADHVFRTHCEAQRDLLLVIAEIDERGIWENDGFDDISHWVAARYSVSRWKALRMLHAGHALCDLPLISLSFASGVLSEDQVL